MTSHQLQLHLPLSAISVETGDTVDRARGAYEPERVQVCLQALLLEEHGYRVEEGIIWYVESR